MSEPVATLPLTPIRIRSRRPQPTSALWSIISPSVSGVPTWSSYSAGAAPVPPSDPSTTMKSGVVSSSTIALQIASSSWRVPTQSLKPAGLPPASSRMWAMKRISSRGVENTLWPGGLTHVCPCGTLRVSAISLVTLAPGRTPPIPAWLPG